MVNLFIGGYGEFHEERARELETCLLKNLSLRSIDRIYVLVEDNCNLPLRSRRIAKILVQKRPTYKVFFETINLVTEEEDVNIIANSDIYFDDQSINLIDMHLGNNRCFALTRYDIHPDQSISFLNRRDSQDCWCFKGKIKHENMFCDFYLGKPGCDNRIANSINEAGYQITNPSKSIRSYHLHNTQIKSYVRSEEHIVPPPYLRLDPVYLQ